MCFTQGSTSSLSTIETPTQQPPSYLSLIPPVPQPPVTPYSPEGGHFYTPAPPIFPGLDVRPRLGSNSSTAGQGMAHGHRSTTLPHPGTHLSTRELYTPATPAFRRPEHHIQRSPSFSTIRRPNPLSPTSGPAAYGTLKMDAGYAGSKSQQNIPPLEQMISLGHLSYGDTASTPIKVDISGLIDKGFFIADNEWTCYRRNYFSCVCSFSLTPLLHNNPIHFVPTGSTQAYSVYGFAMSISAVVSDSDSHTIDLVQHTPKRDKGPIAKPEKVRLSPKPPTASHHPLTSLYAGPDGSLGSSRYEQSFGQAQQSSVPTEHTFERIQFKQATANNGKRRAAQQYYHLIVELWADVGQQAGGDPWVKVAYRKSAKMIVRGRSPGHYQSERRGSSSSGPGGSGGSIGGGGGGGGYSSMLGPGEYSSSSTMLGGAGYGQHYDPRPSGGYGGTRHHQELTMEPMISTEEVKAITDTKAYQYYPATIYESDQDPRHQQQQQQQQQHQQHQQHQQQQQHHQQVELFSHGRHEVSESGPSSSMSATFDPTKVKSEMENGLPSLFYHGGPYYSQRCGRFEGKATSNGQYPTLIPPPATTTMSMT